MTGTQFKIDVTMTSDFPLLSFDSIMPAQGAALLIDPSHPYSPWSDATYTPANGATMPNLADAQMVAMLNNGTTLAEAKPTMYATGTVGTADSGGVVIVRAKTSKGAFRTRGLYTGARLPAKLVDFMIANPSHSWYFSLYTRMNVAAPSLQLSSLRDGTGAYISYMSTDGSVTPSAGSAKHLGNYKAGAGGSNAAGLIHLAQGYKDSAFAAGQTGGSIVAGNQSSIFGPYANSNATDRTTYGAYLENLTVSGRTFAQVLALDQARYAKLFGAGGRYEGDVTL